MLPLSLYKRVVSFVKEALAPAQCIGCGDFGVWLCEECETLTDLKPVAPSNYPHLDGVVAAARYEGVIRDLIHAFKYEGIVEVGKHLGDVAVRSWDESSKECIVTAVPLHPSRRRERGFNQSEVVAQKIAESCGMTYLSLLSKKRATRPQADLTRRERLSNLADIFESNYSLWGSRVLLVDDVLTTGSTLSECARVLKEAGADKVYGLVLSKV